jgi:hypothetical protein
MDEVLGENEVGRPAGPLSYRAADGKWTMVWDVVEVLVSGVEVRANSCELEAANCWVDARACTIRTARGGNAIDGSA